MPLTPGWEQGVDWERMDAIEREAATVPGYSPTRVLPPGWRLTAEALDGAWYVNDTLGLKACQTCAVEGDGRAWLHVSVSRRSRVPSWDDLRIVKELLLGDREGVVILPPKARYVNINPFVLHVFALLDEHAETGLPDFTRGTGSL